MTRQTNLLIIGAGPFGLAMAAYAKSLNIEHLILGKPMDFWKSNMPKGLILRSACDWHLDPLNIDTIENYLQSQNLTPADVEPLSRDFYLGYTKWFQEQKEIEVLPSFVQRLDHANGTNNLFKATVDNGEGITASNVLLALGFRYFKNIPTEIAEIVPSRRFSHTCDLVDFERLRGKRCLIIGGRQSAYEWAALLCENGATAIHVSHRHETPAFEPSDWPWVNPMVDAMVENPGWFRNLPPKEKEEVSKRFWAEGRLKLEPWLWPRIDNDTVKIWPKSRVVGCNALPTGELEVSLNTGKTPIVHHIILATGYKVSMEKVPLLADGTILAKLKTKDGYPVLDEHFQSSIPGLFITSMPASLDFGPFFAFTVSVVASTKIIGSFIKNSGPAVLGRGTE
jgi:FAD-dependent urate hydroxylase